MKKTNIILTIMILVPVTITSSFIAFKIGKGTAKKDMIKESDTTSIAIVKSYTDFTTTEPINYIRYDKDNQIIDLAKVMYPNNIFAYRDYLIGITSKDESVLGTEFTLVNQYNANIESYIPENFNIEELAIQEIKEDDGKIFFATHADMDTVVCYFDMNSREFKSI